MSFQMFQFFFPNGGLVLSLLGRSGKTPPQSCDCSYRTTALLNFSPARLTITAPGARQFLRGKPKLLTYSNSAHSNSAYSNSFSGPHLRAARPRIAFDLAFRCRHRLFREQTKV